MDLQLKDDLLIRWNTYFPGAPLPVVHYYANDARGAEVIESRTRWQCMICDLARVRNGQSIAFTRDSIACGGGRYYAGFEESLRPNIEHFLSCGIEGELEGERYKKTPELAARSIQQFPEIRAEGKYLIFKRWDQLVTDDEPQVAVFFATPDVLSGLFTLANFDTGPEGNVVVPFSSGCGSILAYPLAERRAPRPRTVLGMFDVSARPCVPANVCTFAVPMARLLQMTQNMEESFLTTESWSKVRDRIAREHA